jgi:drug/metabolite transporter (DMT)-like permease
MFQLKNPKIAVPVVLFAGLIWSFGPLVVRYMDEPHLIPWQYIFGRGLTIFILLNLYLFFEEGKNFYKNYFKIGLSGLIGGSGLGVAMISFMFSITNTSACNNFIMFSCYAFFYSTTCFFIFKRKNFFKCLDINYYRNSWYWNYGCR